MAGLDSQQWQFNQWCNPECQTIS